MNITDEFFMVPQDAKGSEIAQNLQKLGDGGVVLVTKGKNEVVGYITRQEIIDVVSVGYNPVEMAAVQMMNTDFMEVMEDDTLGNLMPLICRRYPNAIVVIDYNLKCVGFFSKNDYREALAVLGGYDQSTLPKTPEDWRSRGIAMSSAARFDEAIKCYERAVAFYSNQERGWFELARMLEGASRFKDAITCYDKVVAINPNNDDAWMNRGNVYSILRMPERAAQSFNRAIKLNPGNIGALINLGIVLSDLNKLDQAIACYNKAETIQGKSAELWYRKGNAYDKANKHKEAIKCYDQALKINNNYEDAWFNKGAALHMLGKEKQAIQCMETVLRLNPNNESAREAIAICKNK